MLFSWTLSLFFLCWHKWMSRLVGMTVHSPVHPSVNSWAGPVLLFVSWDAEYIDHSTSRCPGGSFSLPCLTWRPSTRKDSALRPVASLSGTLGRDKILAFSQPYLEHKAWLITETPSVRLAIPLVTPSEAAPVSTQQTTSLFLLPGQERSDINKQKWVGRKIE